MERIKFQHVTFFALLIVLTSSLFAFRHNLDIVNIIIGAIIGAFSAPYTHIKEDK